MIFCSSCDEKLPIHAMEVCEILSVLKATDPSHTISSLIDHSSADPPAEQILGIHNFIEGSLSEDIVDFRKSYLLSLLFYILMSTYSSKLEMARCDFISNRWKYVTPYSILYIDDI